MTPLARPCPHVDCPNLKPCPTHPDRPRNAHWSKDRDRAAQARFRKAVLARDGNQCTRCGHYDPTGKSLIAHHDTPGYDPSCGRTLCNRNANDCHGAIDAHAR